MAPPVAKSGHPDAAIARTPNTVVPNTEACAVTNQCMRHRSSSVKLVEWCKLIQSRNMPHTRAKESSQNKVKHETRKLMRSAANGDMKWSFALYAVWSRCVEHLNEGRCNDPGWMRSATPPAQGIELPQGCLKGCST